jgi:uncharacterized protein (DUF302 family)
MSTHTITRQKYGFSKVVPFGYDLTVGRVKELLKEQGFGVLAEIDIRKAMKEKLNTEYPNYVILGACNPQLAHRALSAEPRLGLLLPCNVTVREISGGTEVSVVDAEAMLAIVENDELRPVAQEAVERLQRVLESV